MPSRNVALSDRHEKLITDLVASGRYRNASEILRDGLRLVEERDQREAATLQALREAARAGSDSIERGDYKELGSFDELDDVIVAITAPIISGSSAQ